MSARRKPFVAHVASDIRVLGPALTTRILLHACVMYARWLVRPRRLALTFPRMPRMGWFYVTGRPEHGAGYTVWWRRGPSITPLFTTRAARARRWLPVAY